MSERDAFKRGVTWTIAVLAHALLGAIEEAEGRAKFDVSHLASIMTECLKAISDAAEDEARERYKG